ncbi:unnamed protein product [Hymenolepis diminuta]|uniref:MARVEL domain-containing protein n=1 Tax=Hymenolepis diminuta TaxID=6216 RepID=A0A0R3SYQ2_HYMDI|nr:unnamed protein product [Hymenolepis diminuta]VUZ42145.1 unnamed protein product [Hymenolepis diminuta]
MPANKTYIKSISGIVKLTICIDLIITLICACVGCYSYRIFFLLVSLFGFIFELCFYLSYVFNLTGKISINWPFADFITSAVLAGLSFINFCVACAFASYSSTNAQDGAAAFFWLVALILFCVDCYYCFLAWRRGSTRTAGPATTGSNFRSEPANVSSYPAYSTDNAGAFEYAN